MFLGRGSGAGGIGKFFAIKRILPQYADSPEFIDMFKDEAKIAINLNHSNIVSIHEFGVEKGQFFLVMDYVEGRNLRQILNKMKKSAAQFSIDQIVFVIREVAAGLDHAHRCIDGTTGKPLNITHRDMSPQNVMVSFEGEVKIVDFGIAKAESQIESTRAGTLKGKFGYMSPEQAEGQPVDLRTDIFSLGIVLWELLANDRLFVANNEINTLRKIRDCQIPSLRKVNPNIHSELERIVQKALARDRNLRYQTGAALHRDLNRFLNRQFPDFSPQDFSVFVKSVFADEILSLRKRLLEYAKVNLTVDLNLKSGSGAAEETSTSLLSDTDDGTLPSDISSSSDLISVSKSSSEIGNLKGDTAVTAPSNSGVQDLSNTSNPSIGTAPSNPSINIATKSFRISSTLTGEDVVKADTDSNVDSRSAPTVVASKSGLLDDNILRNAMNPKTPEPPIPAEHQRNIQPIEIKAGDVLQAADLNVRAPAPETPSSARPSLRVSVARPAETRESGGSGIRVATVAVFIFICLGIYGYLAKNFSGMMSEVIVMTDPLLGPYHRMLGVDPRAAVRAPTGPVTQAPKAVQATLDPFESTGLVVTSNPSGAEIILNEQSTGMVTPSRVEVSGVFSVTIRKKGYADFKVKDTTRETIGHRLDATLQKLNIAYLDVEIFPPHPATLYINGKSYSLRRSTISEVPIPGGTPVKVRVEALNTNTYEEISVTVPTDKRKLIRLNPRRMSRQPSGR